MPSVLIPSFLTLCIGLIAAVGSGLAAGVFFAFSAFVMRGLRSLSAADGIKAMNAINVAAVRRPLMILLFGTALLCLALAIVVFWSWEGRWTGLAPLGAIISLVGCAIYILGAILVTMGQNVPFNNALAATTDAAGPMMWRIYQRDWVKWNHVRTVTCTVACALLFVGSSLHALHLFTVQRERFQQCPELPICLPCPNANTN
jgi:uncharacterized membrane protein